LGSRTRLLGERKIVFSLSVLVACSNAVVGGVGECVKDMFWYDEEGLTERSGTCGLSINSDFLLVNSIALPFPDTKLELLP